MEKQTKLSGRRFLKIVAVSFFLIVIVMIFIGSCKDKKDKNKSEKMIESIKSSLPYGTSFAEVEYYLKKEKIEYSYDKESKCFTAMLHDVSKKGFVWTSISITIKMDEKDKLKDLDTKFVYTGP